MVDNGPVHFNFVSNVYGTISQSQLSGVVRTNDFRWVPTDYRHYGSGGADGNETQGAWRLVWLTAQRGLLAPPLIPWGE